VTVINVLTNADTSWSSIVLKFFDHQWNIANVRIYY